MAGAKTSEMALVGLVNFHNIVEKYTMTQIIKDLYKWIYTVTGKVIFSFILAVIGSISGFSLDRWELFFFSDALAWLIIASAFLDYVDSKEESNNYLVLRFTLRLMTYAAGYQLIDELIGNPKILNFFDLLIILLYIILEVFKKQIDVLKEHVKWK